MTIFEKIANLISGEKKKDMPEKPSNLPIGEKDDVQSKKSSKQDVSAQESQEKKQGSEDYSAPVEQKQVKRSEEKEEEQQLESMDNLRKRICDLSEKLFADIEMEANKKMLIWIDTDELLFKSYDTVKNRESIRSALVNECGVTFEDVAFHIGKPFNEIKNSCTPVGKSGRVMMQVLENKPERIEVHKKASISIFGNSGSLLKDEYILSSDEMREVSVPVYNIGAGEFPQVPTGYRQNHIAIDDNPNSPMVEKNKYVSRKHAHIGFSDEFGFYLQVEIDGTRLMGKRTRIFRGEKIIEMDNPQAKEALQDGDLIELGKAVTLRYFEIKNK